MRARAHVKPDTSHHCIYYATRRGCRGEDASARRDDLEGGDEASCERPFWQNGKEHPPPRAKGTAKSRGGARAEGEKVGARVAVGAPGAVDAPSSARGGDPVKINSFSSTFIAFYVQCVRARFAASYCPASGGGGGAAAQRYYILLFAPDATATDVPLPRYLYYNI